MITPILKDPKAHGGTLYTFPSASRDLTRSFSNSEYEFAFSHFACLNLPDFRYGTFSEGDLKGVYLDNLSNYYPNIDSDSDSLSVDSDSDSLSDKVYNNLNTYLKWHIQSYVMNYEIAILNRVSLNDKNYDTEILKTPSERIFFNWLQKVGAIKFNGNYESLDGYGDDYNGIKYEVLNSEADLETDDKKDPSKTYRIGNKLYVWKGGEWKSRVLVSKTVQYIGTIDMVNNVNIDLDSFNEIYLNIPSGVGMSSDVYFDNDVFDSNYASSDIIDVSKDINCVNPKIIIGRNPENLAMNDVTLNAIYDSKYDNDTGYSSPTYIIDNGYCINFNDDKYVGNSIESMNLNSEEDFEFNCVLIYYRIRKGNGNWQTNLYGVLFLEEVSTSDFDITTNADNERGGYIQRYPKFKKGNSWGLKLDLKIDAQPDSQMELRDKLYDDPNEAIGMQMFSEALVQLNDCANLFYDIKKENTYIEERLYNLENIVSGIDTVYDLRNEVSVLRTKIEMFQPTLNSLSVDVEGLLNKISTLENKFGSLIVDITNKNNKISTLENKYSSLIDDITIKYNNINDRITDLESRLG